MDLLQLPSTGEKFLMREPSVDALLPGQAQDADLLERIALQRTMLKHWRVLRDAIVRSGAEVVGDASDTHQHQRRSGMYARDPGIILHTKNGPRYAMPELPGQTIPGEAQQIAGLLAKEGIPSVTMPGSLDGGNAVYDRQRNLLVVGVNNHVLTSTHYGPMMDALEEEFEAEGLEAPLRFHPHNRVPREQQKAFFDERMEQAAPHRTWLHYARTALNGRADLQGEQPFRVLPLFMKDTHSPDFYHLDRAFNLLPTGQAVVCRAVFNHVTNKLIDKHFGRENIIEVSEYDALDGATNFITVGSRIITPFARPQLRARFEQLGYEVVTPQTMGLPPDAWNFGPGAGPRCATLKLTPDYGYPGAHEKNRGTQAAAVHSFTR